MKRKILFVPFCYTLGCIIEIDVPKCRDPEEFIDEYLDGILSEDVKYNCEWEFVD